MSGRTCTICSHAKRAEIDAEIASGHPFRGISRHFAVSPDAVERHAASHLSDAIKQSQAAKKEAQALDVIKQLKDINEATLDILQKARADKKQHGLALQAIDRVQKQIELQAKLLGDVDEGLPRSVDWSIFNQDELAIIQPIWAQAEERQRGLQENITAIRRVG